MPDEIMASTRDASCYNRPNVSYPKKYHVVKDEFSACGRTSFLCDGHEMPAADVPLRSRCQRKGCKEKWP